MKISELIIILNIALTKYGDIRVCYDGGCDFETPGIHFEEQEGSGILVKSLDLTGNGPQMKEVD